MVIRVEEFFHMIVAVLLFLSALVLYFSGVHRLTEVMASPAFAIEDEVAFESNIQTELDYVEVSQLEATLLRGSEFGIRVVFSDGTNMVIPSECIDEEAVQRISETDAVRYDKKYDYDGQGAIQCLTFTEVN